MSFVYGGEQILNQQQVLWRIVGANMNSTADQAFVKLFTFTNYLVSNIQVVNASGNLGIAAGGVYDTASKGGTALVAAGQLYAALTGATLGLNLTLAAYGLGLRTGANLFLSLTTAVGSPATADVYVVGVPLS